MLLGLVILFSLTLTGQNQQAHFPALRGPYLGQTQPSIQSKVFTPGFVSTEFGELNSVFNRNGNEFYFSRRGVPGKQSKIMVTRLENNLWTEPEPVGFSTSFSDIDLFLTSDGLSMVFCSNRSHQKGEVAKPDHDFWISKREGKKWAEPQLFAKEALSEFEDYFPIVTNSGNLYFNSQRGGSGTNDIYCSTYIDGKYSEAEKLAEPINTQYREFDAFVSPDENMILFSSDRPGGFGGSDIYVSFKGTDGNWSEPKNLGNDINSAKSEYGATISPDGQYLFYTSGKNGNEDIFWVSAEFIEKQRPVEDVFKVLEIVNSQTNASLWPNFKTSEIPVLVFDSINTWLFNSKSMPDGFSEVQEHPGVYRFSGQHPLVWGNSIVRTDDTWVATSVFSRYARRTGEKYSAKDLAGIIIHEQFHIFSRTRHTTWQQNDGYLLFYPTETPEMLVMRRSEKEAFRRAIVSENPGEFAAWALEALNYRALRLEQVPPVFAIYEKQLQRTEGLSDYIERIARGSCPLDASTITNGIAPAGIRDLGYVEGRWIAMILDKLNPGWKSVLEGNDALYLEDILAETLQELPAEPKHFTTLEIDNLTTEAKKDFNSWQERKKREIDKFHAMTGFRIEIKAADNPLFIRIFEPLEIEIMDDRSVFHRVIFSAGNEAGSLRIRDIPCLTEFNNSLGVTMIRIHGLTKEPEVNDLEKRIKFSDGGSSLDLKYSRITLSGPLWTVEL